MPKQVRNTFGKLSRTLHSLGFKSTRYGNAVVFEDTTGRPLILLPVYKNNQTVRPIHLLMVKKLLVESGMIETVNSELEVPAKAKPVTKSPVMIES